MTREQIQAERDGAAATLAQLEEQSQRLQQSINENNVARLQHAGAIAAYDRVLAMMGPVAEDVKADG